MEELATDQDLNLMLVDANDPGGLVDAIQSFAAQAGSDETEPGNAEPGDFSQPLVADKFGPVAVADQYSRMLVDFLARSSK
jgi:hypothetical protein